ncbi:succinate dehydrogenase, cytochrome b556 subunit [Sphingomonas montana]|uniref:succinate dehydrogenase, cytochrome b556 subunit n=1 Tax=Sphingomonas montana TaxID=1843236 RepID=UPI00096D1DA8|nr:succinate dehydrogenase, cytochrome b556 subunit [Sphingomonas montana]
MARNPGRPLSPHLTIWKWGPHMLVSILHRATGVALATGGAMLFTWWLSAIASGPDAYASFSRYVIDADGAGGLPMVTTLLAKIAAVGLTWAFFQHMATGVRHLVLDVGAGYELRTNRMFAKLTMVASTVLTLILWIWAWRN